jgi:hypothetical protein
LLVLASAFLWISLKHQKKIEEKEKEEKAKLKKLREEGKLSNTLSLPFVWSADNECCCFFCTKIIKHF